MVRSLGGKVAVVTGAASGIGRALAVELSKHGCHLALSDIDDEQLADTCSQVKGVRVTSSKLDVADREAVHAYADQVARDHEQVHVVINNAGVALSAPLSVMSYEDLEWLMNINFWGVVHGTKAFLPHLEKTAARPGDWGHIVNLSSIFGIIGVPTQSAYNAAKFAVRGFTEALRLELDQSGSRVSCTCVHPGGVRTNIVRSARVEADNAWVETRGELVSDFDRKTMTTPEVAARDIIRGIRHDKRRVLVGPDARVLDAVQRVLPTGYQRLMALGMRLTRSKG